MSNLKQMKREETISSKLVCEYGCGQEAKHQFKNGKWCCSPYHAQCPEIRRKNSKANKNLSEEIRRKISESLKNPSEETLKRMSKAMKNPSEETLKRMSKAMKNPSEETRKKMSKSHKLTIKKIKEKYKTFSDEEEMRYNPDKLEEKEIQVHCKNGNCLNSKEKDGLMPERSE